MANPLLYLHDQLEQWRAEGTYQHLRILQSEAAAESRFDGKDVINLASNNYLGLTTHPKLREAALEATKKYGVGSGAVRTIAGTMKIHMELEEKIARFKNVEARSEEHTSELQSHVNLVCRLLLEKKNEQGHRQRRAAARARQPTAVCGPHVAPTRSALRRGDAPVSRRARLLRRRDLRLQAGRHPAPPRPLTFFAHATWSVWPAQDSYSAA